MNSVAPFGASVMSPECTAPSARRGSSRTPGRRTRSRRRAAAPTGRSPWPARAASSRRRSARVAASGMHRAARQHAEPVRGRPLAVQRDGQRRAPPGRPRAAPRAAAARPAPVQHRGERADRPARQRRALVGGRPTSGCCWLTNTRTEAGASAVEQVLAQRQQHACRDRRRSGAHRVDQRRPPSAPARAAGRRARSSMPGRVRQHGDRAVDVAARQRDLDAPGERARRAARRAPPRTRPAPPRSAGTRAGAAAPPAA